MPEHDDFIQLLRSTFKVEAAEHLQTISSGLLQLEKAAGKDAERALESVFRAAHTLKGAARAVDLGEIEGLCQSLEDVFASWKRGEAAPSSDMLDTLHRAVDAITSIVSAPDEAARIAERDVEALRDTLQQAPHSSPPRQPVQTVSERPARAPAPPPLKVTHKPAAASEPTLRVAIAKLEAHLLQAEEILAAKLRAIQRAADLREFASGFETWRRAWVLREPDVRALRVSHTDSPVVKRLLDFLDWTLETMKAIESTAVAVSRTAEQDGREFGKLVDDLLAESKKLLLLPFATISASFPKLVRDLCRDEGKEADLTIQGDDVEIDKRILEEIKDPLVHLLRNSVDHGIEMPKERARRGKPARGAITIVVSQIEGNKVRVSLSDDGAGIATSKVTQSAVHHNVITEEEAARLSESDALRLIFASEVTTSPIITQLSGRGLGLAIVQEKAEKLGGEVRVESKPGVGTTFHIVIPATRATFRGILVEAAGRLLVVPTTQVERVARTAPRDIRTVQGRETIPFEGRAVPLVRLADALELPTPKSNEIRAAAMPIMILGSGDQRVAYAVDSVVDEQEVLVKSLRAPLSRVRNVAGATVLGSGQIAPILNVADLLKSARTTPQRRASATAEPHAAVTTPSILVAEDSITSRMLLKSILESAGYRVKTAVDGMEAFTLLRAEPFDLLVSDVEMPRLSGFDLTARVRADPKLADLPVVLVTALGTREDRERGIDAGANAYIVKGTFDQSDLLEAVRRLI